jgi:S1-C subfamily serine protease
MPFKNEEESMNICKRAFISSTFVVAFAISLAYGDELDLNTVLMQWTFKIAGKKSLGTAFIVGKDIPGDAVRGYYILVTAAHVLEEIKEEQAILFLRMKRNDEFVKFPFPIPIRKGGAPLWKKHPEADVAVMYVKLPRVTDIKILNMSFLVTDKKLEEYEIGPGDVLSCLGFPFGAEANEAGFPILRSGQIASYPLLPTSKVKTFLYDFRVFKGNSGGPVFFATGGRFFKRGFAMGKIQFIAGLVSEERVLTEEIESLTETRQARHPLGLAVVVHASLIREAIELLPSAPDS